MYIIKRITQKLRNQSLKSVFIDLITYTYDRYFDFKYNLDTYSWVSNSELVKEDKIALHASEYQSVKVLALRKLLKKIDIKDKTVFLDIGSGKGRILLVASEFKFKEVRGIEFSKKLCDIAEENIKKYKEKVNTSTIFKIINQDAAKYKFRNDEAIFFLYNPFDQFIMKQVFDNISKSFYEHKRDITIIYAYPVNNAFLESYPNIQKKKDYYLLGFSFTTYKLI